MAFGGFDQNTSANHTVAEINMIPLIDVMLVLLVIFMITAPLMTHTVKLDLPKANSSPSQQTDSKPVALAIDAQGQLFWDNEKLSRDALKQRFAEAAKQAPQAELHIRADSAADYHFIAETLADAASAGLSKIGFVSEPEPVK